MSVLSIVLLVLAALAVLGAEWPRFAEAVGAPRRAPRRLADRTQTPRPGRRSHLRVVEAGDADDFVASVRRDLERLPTADRPDDR